ncbi:MAG: glutamate--tRNA ligase [Anaerolineales bacterium]
MTDPVCVRFAPSPTGHMHIGIARTALYDYLLARKTGGRFILRIEDTDQKRLVPGAEQEIIDGLHWLGLDWDEGPDIGGPYGPYRESLAKEIYLEYAHQLIENDKAYPCFCTAERLAAMREEQRRRKEQPVYDGTCRKLSASEAARRVAAGEPHVVRFKTPRDGSTTATDLLRGEITVANNTLGDFILVKSDGLALYHLAAMVDDHRMGVTHVLRGAEWLSTLPLHALVVRAFGWREPVWCHLSVFLKPSGKGKMSKRDSAQMATEGHSIFIRDLMERNVLVIACGGGGIPVAWREGRLQGVEAVIDKDRASALLASRLGVDLFVISTDTDYVYLDYKKPTQRPLHLVGCSELQQYADAGHFPPGNMGPKVESVLRFLMQGGREAIITSCENVYAAVSGSTASGSSESGPVGTHIVPNRVRLDRGVAALDTPVHTELRVGGR